ncbi:putative transcription factor Rap1 [Aspergillus candidus]|uniref:DNA-binding protein RAP1 n=1 Tax=Aspergillus candidus TaxID=41067 RepID=A0A2I2FKV1_ASPCN|nr:hypothetical protein BDW47DRAFT_99783 [Aspergillus candidus]PLB41251.1 hypothetical protein BDW47DRAFT_99783 [Aspergillus candidus]
MVEGGEEGHDGLFKGTQFWLSHNVPQRARFKELITNNGGILRLYEKDADIRLVDHLRKNLPPDTHSYKFVEDSVKQGKMQDLRKYEAGPSAPRPVGATNIPSRSHKRAYTIEDDQILWDWLQPYEEQKTAPVSGNMIYQDLAARYPQHTFQSWRDRYLKRLRGKDRPGGKTYLTPGALASTNTEDRRPPVRDNSQQETPANPEDKKRKRSPQADSEHRNAATSGSPSHKRRPKPTAKAPEERITRPQETKPQTNELPSTPIPNKSNANAAAQAQNAQIPPPPVVDNDFDPTLIQLPFFPGSPEPEESPPQDIDTWIDERLRTGKAKDEDQIVEALRRASMDPVLADRVLESLAAGRGIPDNMPGVWTPDDDRDMESADGRRVNRVIQKHGNEAFDNRWEYLNMARATGLEGN